MSRDFNVCEFCSTYVKMEDVICPRCRQALLFEGDERIVIWQLGDIGDGILGPICMGLRKAFGRGVIIQPACLDERPSFRSGWKGISAGVFLNQVLRRHRKGTFVNLGVTARNIVPSQRYNFLFGYAYLGLPAATISLHPLSQDEPDSGLLIERALKIAIHEIGHTLDLDHHAYEDGVNCCMTADETRDCLELLDSGTSGFCASCRKRIKSFKPS